MLTKITRLVLALVLVSAPAHAACRAYSSIFVSGSKAGDNDTKAALGQVPDFCFDVSFSSDARASLASADEVARLTQKDIARTLGQTSKLSTLLKGYAPVELDRVELRVLDTYGDGAKQQQPVAACEGAAPRNLCLSLKAGATADDIKDYLLKNGHFAPVGLWSKIVSSGKPLPVQVADPADAKTVAAGQTEGGFKVDEKQGTIVPAE